MGGSSSFAPGAIFARDFRIERPLSEGGMGAVFVAEQISTGKQRALKIMQPELVGDARLRERFVQEARIGSRIESDHVVEVVGAGIDDASGMPWLAMELLRGQTLAERIAARGALPPAEVLEILKQLCHGLGLAHEAGIVHRDLKPENVFLATPRREGVAFTVKVLDFGIAKLVAEVRTKATAAIGTPLYMPPEQMEPGRAIVPASDVWALGLIAFVCLAGKSYWRAASVENPTPLMIVNEVSALPMPPASERARQLGAATLPAGFDAWFARATSRPIEARFAGAREAFAALAPILAGGRSQLAAQTVAAAPIMVAPPSPAAARTERVRHPVAPGAGAGTGCIVAAVLGVGALVVGGAFAAFVFLRRPADDPAEPLASAAALDTTPAPSAVPLADTAPATPVTSASAVAAASSAPASAASIAPLAPLHAAPGDAVAGDYWCTIDTYSAMACRISRKPNGTLYLEKLAGSQRFKGPLTLSGDNLVFHGTYFCPFGACTEPVSGTFVKRGAGHYAGTLHGSEPAKVVLRKK